jgi:hypothetical protein
MARTIIIGDVHACSRELSALLEHVAFARGVDRLVLAGDVLVRGPDPLGTLDLMRDLGAAAVRGNHENKLLSAMGADGHLRSHARLGGEHERVARMLRDEDWRTLEAMPLWLDLPAHGVRVVHAGVMPGMPVERTPPEALMTMRTIDARGRWSDKQHAGDLWGASYIGPPHVVFGHNARPEAQLHPWATGIDTGCVYGGRLTAVVLGPGEAMPRGEAARAKLVSVPAAQRYYVPSK